MSSQRWRTALDVPYTVRLAKVMSNKLRMKIVMELSMREMSPKEFFDEFGGGTLSRVAESFRVLADYGWIHMTRTATGGRRRSATEHYYRATEPIIYYNDTWAALPGPIKEMISGGIFEEFFGRVREAMAAGTIDSRSDRHASWMPGRVDQQGWENIIGSIDALFHRIREELEEAGQRLAESGEEPIPMTVALAAFESPKDTEKLP